MQVIIKIHDIPPAKKFTYDIISMTSLLCHCFWGLLLKGEAVDVEMTAQLLYLPRRRDGGREGGR